MTLSEDDSHIDQCVPSLSGPENVTANVLLPTAINLTWDSPPAPCRSPTNYSVHYVSMNCGNDHSEVD